MFFFYFEYLLSFIFRLFVSQINHNSEIGILENSLADVKSELATVRTFLVPFSNEDALRGLGIYDGPDDWVTRTSMKTHTDWSNAKLSHPLIAQKVKEGLRQINLKV